jgi:hypothetical protein
VHWQPATLLEKGIMKLMFNRKQLHHIESRKELNFNPNYLSIFWFYLENCFSFRDFGGRTIHAGSLSMKWICTFERFSSAVMIPASIFIRSLASSKKDFRRLPSTFCLWSSSAFSSSAVT